MMDEEVVVSQGFPLWAVCDTGDGESWVAVVAGWTHRDPRHSYKPILVPLGIAGSSAFAPQPQYGTVTYYASQLEANMALARIAGEYARTAANSAAISTESQDHA